MIIIFNKYLKIFLKYMKTGDKTKPGSQEVLQVQTLPSHQDHPISAKR